WTVPRRRGPLPGRQAPSRQARGSKGGQSPTAGYCVEPAPLVPVPAPGGLGAEGGCELPEAVLSDFHPGIFFKSSAVLPILKRSFPPSHLNASTGRATRWLPTPSTPPSLTTRRSTFFECVSISTAETSPIFLSSLP